MAGSGSSSGSDSSADDGRAFRQLCREGRHTGHSSGHAVEYAHANLVILPQRYAYDFLLFCQRNPKPCPLLDVSDVGAASMPLTAPDSDVYTDAPRYLVFRDGELTDEVTDATPFRQSDMVAFALGCSFSFEAPLVEAGIPVRHWDEVTAEGAPKNVPMFETNVPCNAAGPFRGNLVVSMRPVKHGDVPRASLVTARFPSVHGAPVHVGDPAALGIADIGRPDFGDAVTVHAGEVPVFWACGVTPQLAIRNAKPDIAITHAPGAMFVTDKRNADLAAFP